jgi:hypothetical protein
MLNNKGGVTKARAREEGNANPTWHYHLDYDTLRRRYNITSGDAPVVAAPQPIDCDEDIAAWERKRDENQDAAGKDASPMDETDGENADEPESESLDEEDDGTVEHQDKRARM